jgi:hypothetical protein
VWNYLYLGFHVASSSSLVYFAFLFCLFGGAPTVAYPSPSFSSRLLLRLHHICLLHSDDRFSPSASLLTGEEVTGAVPDPGCGNPDSPCLGKEKIVAVPDPGSGDIH